VWVVVKTPFLKEVCIFCRRPVLFGWMGEVCPHERGGDFS